MSSDTPGLLPHLIPTPSDPTTMQRWEHTRLRRRLLTGSWRGDLEARLVQEVGTVRRSAWGIPKITSNPFATICRELSSLYAREPEVRAPRGDAIYGPLAEGIRQSGLWARAGDFQAMVLGLREALWRVDVSPAGRVSYRPVWPDLVEAEAAEDLPDQPVAIRELRFRHNHGWCWDILDLRDDPRYRVESWDGADVSEDVLGGSYDGDNYPYRYATGEPFLPYVLYHARSLGDCLWHSMDGVETLEASLDLAVSYTMLGHVLRDASWPQRWMLGCSPAGLDVADADGRTPRREVVTDPASVLKLAVDPDFSGQPNVGQWTAGGSPAELEGVISSMANRIAIEAGLPPADIQRLGGTARSGYAIALSNEGKRAAARRFAPIFRSADEELVGKTSALMNRALGLALPEQSYSVIYQDLPLSPDELQARRTNTLELLAAKMISRRDAYIELHPGISADQAQADLDAIAEEIAGTQGSVEPMSGIQIAQAAALLAQGAQGQLPRASVQAALVRLLQIGEADASAMLASIGQGFVPVADTTTTTTSGA